MTKLMGKHEISRSYHSPAYTHTEYLVIKRNEIAAMPNFNNGRNISLMTS
jgi:hypothetical protein